MSKTQGKVKLVSNPLTDLNAHLHKSNHPSGLEETQQYVEFLESQGSYFSIYPHTIQDVEAAAALGIDVNAMSSNDLEAIVKYKKTDFESLLRYLDHKGANIVLIKMSNPVPLYFAKSRSNVLPYESNYLKGTQDQIRQRIDDLFFKQSQQQWQDIGLTNKWDQRERLALNTRPFDIQYFDVDLPAAALSVDSHDLWHHGDQIIVEIMNHCQMTIDSTRIEPWTKIYFDWQKIQLDTLWFQYQHQHILKAIVEGKSMQIDLTFDQEIIIQHCLIYQYNLNLKTWGLEKFPNNTLELHQLLEPNIHSVPTIY